MTFGDKLRAMSDEQYAEFFTAFAATQRNAIFEKLHSMGIAVNVSVVEIPMVTKMAHMEWIQSEVEETEYEAQE